MRTFSSTGLELLKRLESCRLDAYIDQTGRIVTIGWGHTGPDVYVGLHWTQERADKCLLEEDLPRFVTGVDQALGEEIILSENKFSALVIFSYNEGVKALATSHLLKYIKGGVWGMVPAEWRRWNKIHLKTGQLVVSNDLKIRREAEIRLWNTP